MPRKIFYLELEISVLKYLKTCFTWIFCHPQFTGVMSAVKEGHLANLNAALEQHEQVDGWHLSFQWANFDQVFIKWGIFLILEKLKMITYRNLFKRVKLWYLIILIFKFSGDPGAEEPPDFHPVLHLCSQADGGRKWKDDYFCKMIQLKNVFEQVEDIDDDETACIIANLINDGN